MVKVCSLAGWGKTTGGLVQHSYCHNTFSLLIFIFGKKCCDNTPDVMRHALATC